MKKIVWITFFSALVIVNALAWLADYAGGVYIAIPYRLVLVMAITMIATVFVGAWVLMTQAGEEVPTTRTALMPTSPPTPDPTADTSADVASDPTSGLGSDQNSNPPAKNSSAS